MPLIIKESPPIIIEEPEPIQVEVTQEAEPPIIEVENVEAKPLPPVYRRRETRVKFNYLRKRHNITPHFDKIPNE